MTYYASSGITCFVPGHGLACQGHSIHDADKADPDYPYLSVDCPDCNPILARDPGHWATSAAERPLTGPELKELERQKLAAQEQDIRMTDSMARVLRKLAATTDYTNP